MSKITQESIDAFMAGREFSKQNMSVAIRPWQYATPAIDSVILCLHGNPIARYVSGQRDRTLMVCDGGWQTVTTRERLNGIPGVRVNQKDRQWYLNGVEWDGSWTYVTDRFSAERIPNTGHYLVHYPRAMQRGSVEFPNKEAAVAFATVEAANHGVELEL